MVHVIFWEKLGAVNVSLIQVRTQKLVASLLLVFIFQLEKRVFIVSSFVFGIFWCNVLIFLFFHFLRFVLSFYVEQLGCYQTVEWKISIILQIIQMNNFFFQCVHVSMINHFLFLKWKRYLLNNCHKYRFDVHLKR